jgi:hypothetical protein
MLVAVHTFLITPDLCVALTGLPSLGLAHTQAPGPVRSPPRGSHREEAACSPAALAAEMWGEASSEATPGEGREESSCLAWSPPHAGRIAWAVGACTAIT